MVYSGVTDVRANDNLEKAEVWEEDLEEGEVYETEDGDLEKGVQGAVCETSDPGLLEPLLTPEDAEHQGLAAASKKLVPMDKIIASLLVVSFVLVVSYFAGRSFRNWIDSNELLNKDNGKSMNNTAGSFLSSTPLWM